MKEALDKFWHKTLKRPYHLAQTIEEGKGQTIVLLHGIGRTGRVWDHVVEQLKLLPENLRVISFDLLGFGDSPTPEWLDYTVDDHAQAVIASLSKLRTKHPVVIVGHSMGCLVAVRVARLRPDLVRHLVLYEMPLHKGLPETLSYRWRLDLYRRVFDWLIKYPLSFDEQAARKMEWLTRKIVGVDVDRDSWVPYIKSLENTIINQNTSEDLKQLAMSMDIIYGNMDLLVIRGKEQQIFGKDLPNVTMHTVAAKHAISTKASRFIAQRVIAALRREHVF